jgi:hypothetical protein
MSGPRLAQTTLQGKQLRRAVGGEALDRIANLEQKLVVTANAVQENAKATIELTVPLRLNFWGRVKWLVRGA